VPEDPEDRISENDENESLLGELRAIAAQVDPVPRRLKEAARAGLSWRTIDAELAELTFDSLAQESTRALVRGRQGVRLLSFEASIQPRLAITLEVLVAGPGRRLVGQLDPPQTAEVEIRQPHGMLSIGTDERGRFSVDVSAGPVSLRCHTSAQPPGAIVVTDWISI
jgi:hypothetical protein